MSAPDFSVVIVNWNGREFLRACLESLRENARQLVALKEELRPMVPAYPRLPMPIALVHGDADTTVGLDIHSRPFARQVPHARLAVLPGIGHMLHQVAAPEVVGGIRAVAG